MLLIKLGGSIITNKERPLSARRKAIDGIIKALKKIDAPLVLVHGGGSYGHYWSVKYGMHTKPAKYGAKGVSVVKNSMIELNRIILDALLKNGLHPYCLPPTDFVAGGRPIESKIIEAGRIAKSGLIPVTYGDALWHGQGKSYILSGDKIMSMLAQTLRPRLSMFVMNVDGLYSDLKTGDLIRELKGEKPAISKTGMDVTGGMKRKLDEAQNIRRMGLDVFFVNGNRPQRIQDAAAKKRFEGTLFRGR